MRSYPLEHQSQAVALGEPTRVLFAHLHVYLHTSSCCRLALNVHGVNSPLVGCMLLVLESFFFLYSTYAEVLPMSDVFFFVITALSTRTHKTNDQSNPMNPNPEKQ